MDYYGVEISSRKLHTWSSSNSQKYLEIGRKEWTLNVKQKNQIRTTMEMDGFNHHLWFSSIISLLLIRLQRVFNEAICERGCGWLVGNKGSLVVWTWTAYVWKSMA